MADRTAAARWCPGLVPVYDDSCFEYCPDPRHPPGSVILHDYAVHRMIMQTDMGISVAIVGASGYAGGELVRLLDEHPTLEVGHLGAHTQAGSPLGSVHPHLRGSDRVLGPLVPEDVSAIDAAFLALPHGASWEVGEQLARAGIKVFDLGSDFRLDTPERYEEAYGAPHPLPDQLERWTYGLPELFGGHLAGADRVAVPGCFPTSALLGLAPLYRAGALEGAAIVDSLTGVTGAGRAARGDLMFGAVAEGARAYGVATHRHRPEMEMGLQMAAGIEVAVQFTPHVVPIQRGILSTCSAASTGRVSPAEVLRDTYAASPFVDVVDHPPQTRWVTGSNRALIHAVEDRHTGRVIVLVAIDNLLKGAAGQAVQCANVALGLPETSGLPLAGFLP